MPTEGYRDAEKATEACHPPPLEVMYARECRSLRAAVHNTAGITNEMSPFVYKTGVYVTKIDLKQSFWSNTAVKL